MISVICDLFCGLVLSRRTLVYKATHLCVYIGVSRWFVLILRLHWGGAAAACRCSCCHTPCPRPLPFRHTHSPLRDIYESLQTVVKRLPFHRCTTSLLGNGGGDGGGGGLAVPTQTLPVNKAVPWGTDGAHPLLYSDKFIPRPRQLVWAGPHCTDLPSTC